MDVCAFGSWMSAPKCSFFKDFEGLPEVFDPDVRPNLGKKKTNKHKEFWRDTPWCASRLSRGHVPSVPWYVPSVPGTFCPFSIDLHTNQAQMSQVSLGRPEFVPGTPPGHPGRQIPLCDFSLSVFFFSIRMTPGRPRDIRHENSLFGLLLRS